MMRRYPELADKLGYWPASTDEAHNRPPAPGRTHEAVLASQTDAPEWDSMGRQPRSPRTWTPSSARYFTLQRSIMTLAPPFEYSVQSSLLRDYLD